MAEHKLTTAEREEACICAEIAAFMGNSLSDDAIMGICDMHTESVEAIIAARLAPVEALHPRIPIRPWADDCTAENHVHDPDDFGIADVCFTCPPTGDAVCGRCYDGDGGDPEPWPCPTMVALAPVEPATEEADRG